MKLTLWGAAALAATVCFGPAANAAVQHDFGTVTGFEDYSLSETFAGHETFSYQFQLTSAGTVFGSWNSLPIPYGGGLYAVATNALAGSFSLLGGPYSHLQYHSSSGNGSDGFSFNVGPGSYTLVFAADSNPYNRNALFTTYASVSAVPEPQTFALLLAGIGAAGFMARRRQRD